MKVVNEEAYKNYLDRWDVNWKLIGEKTVKNCINCLDKWFHLEPIKILDVGCMNGYILDAFINRGYDAWGIEPLWFWMLSDYPEKIFKVRLDKFVSDMKFDFIVCYEVMEHIPEDMIIPSFEVLRKALNGVLFMTISEDKDVDPTHLTIKPRNWWLDKLDKTGFTYYPNNVTLKGFNFYCLT